MLPYRAAAAKTFIASGLLLASAIARCADLPRPDFAAALHSAFDDKLDVTAATERLTPKKTDGIVFVEGKVGKAASFRQGQFVEFRNLPRMDLHSATLEFWVKPDFERSEPNEHYFLRLLTTDGKDGLDAFFSVNNCGFKTVMAAGGKKADAAADYAFNPRKWNQVVIAWQTGDSELSGLRLYINGAMHTFVPSFSLMRPPDILRIGCKSQEEGSFADAALDEFSLYNRCLTELQVRELYLTVDRGPERIALIRQRITEEDAAAKARMGDFVKNHKMAMIIGRTVTGLPDSLFKTIGLPVPERIHEKDFETADLSKYDLLFFPGGGGYVFTEKAQQRLRDFIANGGGYVGICAGAYAAKTFKLVDCNYLSFRERGSVEVELKKHPITEGFGPGRVMWLRHANGPFIEPSKDVQVVVSYHSGPPYAAIVAKQMGKGRIVVISPHPESDADSRPLVRNALFWAAKVLGSEQKQ